MPTCPIIAGPVTNTATSLLNGTHNSQSPLAPSSSVQQFLELEDTSKDSGHSIDTGSCMRPQIIVSISPSVTPPVLCQGHRRRKGGGGGGGGG